MVALVIHPNGGIIPKLTVRQLPDGAAQAATNIKTASGEVRPYRRSKVTYTPSKPLPPLSIYKAVWNTTSAWLTWPYDVNAARFPVSTDAEPRFGWTGDGEPRWGKFSMLSAGGGNDYPATAYALGIPNPTVAPTVGHSGGSGVAQTRFYLYTYFSQDGEESGPSPVSASTVGKVDGTWAISNMAAFPTNSGVGTASHSAGFTTFTNTGAAPTWLRVGDEVIISGNKLKVTECPTAASFKVPGNYAAATAWARVAPWNTNGMKRRLYRTAGTAAGFQLVNDNVGTSYNDTLTDAQIMGDDLISDGWKPPPPSLAGLFITPFGSACGFVGNKLYLSEPFQPHAFMDKFTFATDYDIVAADLSGQDIAVATTAVLYIGVGSDPSAFALTRTKFAFPCLSKRSMVSDGNAAMYASKFGVVAVVGGGATVISMPLFTVDEWLPLAPATMFYAMAYGNLYMGYDDDGGDKRMFCLEGSSSKLFNLDIKCSSLYTDDTSGTLFMGTELGVEEFDPQDGLPMSLEWQSKEFTLPKPVNFGAAKVEFDVAIDPERQAEMQAEYDAVAAQNQALLLSDIGGTLGDTYFGEYMFGGDALLELPPLPAQNTVSFTLFNSGKMMYSRVIDSPDAFRLPAGFKMDKPSIQVNSQCPIQRILVAETMQELATA